LSVNYASAKIPKDKVIMRSILIGAGQVGGIIGGRLLRAGHELTFCDVDREHVEAIRRGGLKRGEKTEVDGIIGAVIREGERLGVSPPLCRATLKVHLEVENRQRPIGMQNYQELYSVG
jgi:ketopantoate reductase